MSSAIRYANHRSRGRGLLLDVKTLRKKGLVSAVSSGSSPLGRCRARVMSMAAATVVGLLGVIASTPSVAQGFSWPWENDSPRPIPREPIRREPARPAPPPVQSGSQAGWETERSSICLRLEQRLVQETQRGSQVQSVLPRIEADLRQNEQDLRKLQTKLDRSDCYEWFLFTKQLRNTRECRALSNDVDEGKRRRAELEAERQDIQSTGGRSIQDEIVRELARNSCGSSYAQEARRREGSSSFGVWQDEGGGGGGMGNSYSSVPFATYRTVCVRLCDGYYFPVSFSTLPNHFQRDAEVCQSKCAAPAQLYYYQNPGGAVEDMQAFDTNDKYTSLRTAFMYRKEYVQGCSCKQAEYLPQTPMPGGGVPRQTGSTDVPPPSSTTRAPQIGEALDPWRPR